MTDNDKDLFADGMNALPETTEFRESLSVDETNVLRAKLGEIFFNLPVMQFIFFVIHIFVQTSLIV